MRGRNIKKLVILSGLLLITSVIVILLIFKISLVFQERTVNSYIKKINKSNNGLETFQEYDEEKGHNDDEGNECLHIGIAPITSPEVSLKLYSPLTRYIENALGCRVEMVLKSSYDEINELVKHGLCDMAFTCTYPFIMGEREFGMKMIAVPQINGKTTYNSYIIVRRDSNISSLLDLKGKKFAIADYMSTTGWLFPATWLKKHGRDPKTFFSQYIITHAHDKSIMLVANGYADGAAVDSIVFNYQPESIKEKLKIILISQDFGVPPVVIRPGLKQELVKKLQKILITMHENPEGKKALSNLHYDRFVLPPKNFYDNLKKMIAFWEKNR